MKKLILIAIVMLAICVTAQNAMAVDLRNAEDFRIEVIAEPKYVDETPNVGSYCVDIVAINNSNDVIDLRGLSIKGIRIIPLEGGLTGFRFTVNFLKRVPAETNIKPHSKVLLRSFETSCYTETIMPDGVIYKRPIRDVLIKVSGLYNGLYYNETIFSSSVRARYKDIVRWIVHEEK